MPSAFGEGALAASMLMAAHGRPNGALCRLGSTRSGHDPGPILLCEVDSGEHFWRFLSASEPMKTERIARKV